jgi:hypothetical protein
MEATMKRVKQPDEIKKPLVVHYNQDVKTPLGKGVVKGRTFIDDPLHKHEERVLVSLRYENIKEGVTTNAIAFSKRVEGGITQIWAFKPEDLESV